MRNFGLFKLEEHRVELFNAPFFLYKSIGACLVSSGKTENITLRIIEKRNHLANHCEVVSSVFYVRTCFLCLDFFCYFVRYFFKILSRIVSLSIFLVQKNQS